MHGINTYFFLACMSSQTKYGFGMIHVTIKIVNVEKKLIRLNQFNIQKYHTHVKYTLQIIRCFKLKIRSLVLSS